jgi:hypothetical protein
MILIVLYFCKFPKQQELMIAISYKAFFGVCLCFMVGLCCSKKRVAKEPGFLAIINPCHQFLHCTHVCSKEKQTLANSKAAHIMKSFANKSHASFT